VETEVGTLPIPVSTDSLTLVVSSSSSRAAGAACGWLRYAYDSTADGNVVSGSSVPFST
jgi:hypothetical protein